MIYEYPGTVQEKLAESYRTDESPFPTDDSRVYPRRESLRDEFPLLKQLLFPRCWNAAELTDNPGEIRTRLSELGTCVLKGITAYSGRDADDLGSVVDHTLDQLPTVRNALKKDVEAAYKGDPAAKSYCEIIRSYPSFHAVLTHRIANILYRQDCSAYARELAEYSKSETGIDIHPGADIGEYFFVDHGTGVVVGETTTVGDWVRIYQNVTLGALHFEKEEDEDHMLKKDYKRHPDIGDHVVIGAGSNVLGPVEIGDNVSIGANAWVTDDVPDDTSVFITNHPEQRRKSND